MRDSMPRMGKCGVRSSSRGGEMSSGVSSAVLLVVWISLGGLWAAVGQPRGDSECLQEFKDSVSDPSGALANWTFDNATSAVICSFSGIQCVHGNDGIVFSMLLHGFALGGSFPAGLSKCTSLQILDLSLNEFSGPISPTLCTDVPNLVKANLNDNNFSRSIPYDLGSCEFLNYLFLQDNRLTDAIPASLGDLPRLTEFNVSNNDLSGEIPFNLSKKINTSTSYEGNPKLCGPPLNNKTGCSSG